MLCTARDFEKRVGALYIFAWLVFATFPLSLSLTQAKGFVKILKHTLHWHKTKICKSVEKNFYLFFIQSLIDMTEMFRRSAKYPGTENQLRDVGYFQPSPWVFSLALLSAQSLGKGGRESLLVTSHLTSRERLGLRLGYFLLIRVYCSRCCRRCYCG